MLNKIIKNLIIILGLTTTFFTYADADHAMKEYEAGHYADALREVVPLAEQGNAVAQLTLGRMYDRGHGVQKNIQKAISWYFKAANQGQRAAQFNIGEMYQRGEGLPRDSIKAAEWYLKSANQDYRLAQFSLGRMYANGDGVPLDGKKAAEWLTKAAAQGDALNQLYLAVMYLGGKGIPENPKLSAEWATKSANQALPGAQYFLGTLYQSGTGVPKNQEIADKWFAEAAKQGVTGLGSLTSSLSNSTISSEAKTFTDLTKKAQALWNELNGFRYEPAFHQYGYMQGSKPGGSWVNRQKALSEECSSYRDKLAVEIKSQYNLCGIIQYMWLVGIDWYGNQGNNKSGTVSMTSQIEKSLKNGGKTTI